MKTLTIFTLLTLLGLLSCCRDDDPCAICPPPHTPTIALTIDDVGVTDAWLKLESVDSTALGNVTLLRDTIQVLNANILSRDTIILDEGLLPKKHYAYKAYRMDGSMRSDSSTSLNVLSLDTTAGEWHWTLDTLGDGNGSLFNDVCIVNDTLAYAVGNIQVLDSSNNFVLHNLAVWDGQTWSLKRISVPHYNFDCTFAFDAPPPLSTVFLFETKKILLGVNALLTVDSTTYLPCLPRNYLNGGIMKTWGVSENDFYAVGGNGTLIRYLNGEWKKIESGTTLDIQDIWGTENQRTGKTEILAVASKKFTSQESKLISISGDAAILLPDSGLRRSSQGIWFDPGKRYYLAGSGTWTKINHNTTVWSRAAGTQFFNYFQDAIDANNRNDIVIVCDYGDVLCFNGITWRSYLQTTAINGIYESVAMKENLIIAVGYVNSKAVIAMGRR